MRLIPETTVLGDIDDARLLVGDRRQQTPGTQQALVSDIAGNTAKGLEKPVQL